MIPQRMAFYWEGGPMSWLRLQTLDTFTRLHPHWELVRIPTLADPRFASLPLDTRSDIARWRWLADRGGWFMDTDIVWLQAIPDDLQDGPVAVTSDSGTEAPTGHHFAMGLIGSEAGGRLVVATSEIAEQRATDRDHQSAGTRALAEAAALTIAVGRLLPGRLLYPWGHSQRALDNAWDPEIELPDGLLGLHWSGGHPSSRAAEQWATAEWARHSRVPVAQAIRKAYGR